MKLQVSVTPNGKTKGDKAAPKRKATGASNSHRDCLPSTNVSSPIQSAAQRRVARERKEIQNHQLHGNGYERDNFVVSDEESVRYEPSDEEAEANFEPVRIYGKPHKSRKRALGPPITIDQKMASLNETHRAFVEDFVIQAKKEAGRVSEYLSILTALHLSLFN